MPHLKITVSDTGTGIALENRQNLFHAFSQADPSMTRKFGGTGLGLILSKKLSQALGGDVQLTQSEIGKGSTFVITVELTPVAEAKMVASENLIISDSLATLATEEKGRLKGLMVLLVEDSPDNRMLLSLYLEKTGAHVETAVDGFEGVEKALKIMPDATLMDIEMPRMDGHAAIKKLRAQGFSKPIIALTAHAIWEERDKCFESG